MTTPARTPRSSEGSRRPRRGTLARAVATVGLAGALALAGCAADTGESGGTPSNPHGTAAGGQPGTGATTPAPASEGASGTPSGGVAADARADQRAVGAAAARAGSFGFVNQVTASDAEIASTREEARLRQTNTSGTTVEPAACKAPLTAIDWSPILMPGADASRLDFGSETFAGTGTVEVATLEDAEVVRNHLANVERLIADCPELSMTVTDTNRQSSTFDFTARASAAGDAAVESGLIWTRTPEGTGPGGVPAEQTTAQVLIGQTGDHVVMVSFLGDSAVAGEEFTTMAEQILASALEAL
jgi:hypothetical protein